MNQLLAQRLLEKRGHQVVTVNNGREALLALDRERFDLILMDIHMPQLDGLEATQAIRESESQTNRQIPIIAMTACAMKGDQERCLSAGMNGYIAKPLRAEELFKVVEEHCAPLVGVMQ